jgi:hypothetical protein
MVKGMRVEAGGIVRTVANASAVEDDPVEDFAAGRKLVSVSNVSRRVAEDYAAGEAATAAVKIKSRGKKRRQPMSISSLSDLANESIQNDDDGDVEMNVDHGSRSSGRTVKQNIEQIQELKKRQSNYELAMEKSELKTKKLKTEHVGSLFDDEEDDRELQMQLQRSRRLNLQKKDSEVEDEMDDERVLAAIQLARQRNREFEENLKSEDRITFSSAIQFAGALDSALDADSITVKHEDEPVPVPSKALPESQGDPVAVKKEEEQDTDSRMEEDDEKKASTENALGLTEPIIDRGLGKVLDLIRSRGLVHQTLKVGRPNDERHRVHGDDDNRIQLKHLDEEGNEMTEKEAFRYLSQHFHGQKLGISKKEKKQKMINKELKARKKAGGAGGMNALEKLQKVGEKTGQAYVVVDTKALATGTGAVAQKKFSGST